MFGQGDEDFGKADVDFPLVDEDFRQADEDFRQADEDLELTKVEEKGFNMEVVSRQSSMNTVALPEIEGPLFFVVSELGFQD